MIGRPYVSPGTPADMTPEQDEAAQAIESQHDWAERGYRADGLLEVRVMRPNGIIDAIHVLLPDGSTDEVLR